MRIVEKITELFGKYMAGIVLLVSIVSFIFPPAALWIRTSWINSLLMVIMFGMGLTVRPLDFLIILKRPKDILAGCIGQFTIMPLLAAILISLFQLDPALTAGVVLVGTCPGGTASNVITYLAGGDVALSVGMTSINTLLAPVLTPAITWLILRTVVTVNAATMFLSIVKVILVPIGLGLLCNKLFEKTTRKMVKVLPVFSTIAICMIIAAVVSHNAEKIAASGLIVLAVVIIHNLCGYLCGFFLARLLKLSPEKSIAMSVEIGMQNSGLATSLAASSFPDLAMATVPGAMFSVWHNLSGAILAGICRRVRMDRKR